MTNSTTQDPATIERDIRRTQEDMSRTVDKIGDQLTIKNIFNALLDKADENDVDARMLVDGARRNPIALGLIAAGAIWLVSDKDSKFPTISKDNKFDSNDGNGFEGGDIHHRDYVSHMSSLEMRDGEDALAYQRRRDLHRANFLMCEQRPDEDESGFRKRLDDLTESFREKRRAWSDSTSKAGSATMEKGRAAAGRVQDMYGSNPLIGGILAAAVGAAFGSSIPISRKEQETLGGLGEKARDLASEQKEQLTSQIREKKDELLEKADEKLQKSPSEGGQPGSSSSTGSTHPSSGSNEQSQPEPFIIGERTNN